MKAASGYITARDGTRIRYQCVGTGRPILCCNGLGVPIYFWRHLCAAFADRYQIVCWDYRGHGRSALPRRPYHVQFTDFADDGLALVRHLDLREVIGIGHSAGFQVLLEMYRQEPARFAALASFLGTYGRALSFLFDSPLSRVIFDGFYVAAVLYPRTIQLLIQGVSRSSLAYYLGGMLGILNLDEAQRRELQVYFDHVCRMDPRFFATLTQSAEAHDAEAVLARITVPTLLIAAEHDKFAPLRIAQTMARRIPQAALVVIPDGSHGALMECPQFFNRQLARFLARQESRS